MKEKKSKKACNEYERRWRNYCVDKNLDDEWLERLNKLKAFRLVGICEGHMKRRSGSTSKYPNVNLTLQDEFIDRVAEKWPDLKTALLKESKKIFEDDETKIRLEMNHRLRIRKRKIVSQDEMKIRMVSNRSRDRDELGKEMMRWFEGCISQIEELDRIVYSWHKRLAT